MIDNNTVGFWVFNKTGNIPNSAVGKSAIAVANDLVPHGGLTQVDGHCDYAIQGDGSTGYYTSANSTGFPVGASEREVDFLFTGNAKGVAQDMIVFGTNSTTDMVMLGLVTTNLSIYLNGTTYDTGFVIETDRIYLLSVTYNGSVFSVYMNGNKIYSVNITLVTGLSVVTIAKYNQGSSSYSSCIIPFFIICILYLVHTVK